MVLSRPRLIAVAAATTAAAAALVVPTGSVAADVRTHTTNLRVFGVTQSDVLVRFPAAYPAALNRVGPVTGLAAGETLIGIDFRVQDGLLYGVGDAGNIYTITRRTAVATEVSELTVPLSGEEFGVDFNPAADALRIISDDTQNLRHSFPTDTTTVDTPLTNPPVPPATTPTPATGVTMAAYTNNDLDTTTGTTLFDVDTDLDRIAIQAPANNGTLNPTGGIGVDAQARGDIDVYSGLNDDGRTDANVFFATIKIPGEAHKLYRLAPLTGLLTEVGRFGNGAAVVDVALPLDQN